MRHITLPSKLDVGCAFRKPKGYYGIDQILLPGVDKKVDLRKFPWPLPENHFEKIRLWHILQFLPETVKTMEEVWRLAKHNSIVEIAVPYYMSALAFGDPGHIRHFTEETFKYFTSESWYLKHHDKYTKAKFEIVSQKLRTTGRLRRFIPFAKIFRYFLWNMVDELIIEMRVLKK